MFFKYIIKNLLIGIIFTTILIIIIHYETYFYKTITIDDTIKKAKTGDLILFRWSFMDPIFRCFTKFCHVGMVIKMNNKLYILETHPEEYDDDDIDKINPKKGVNMYELDDRLREYDGTCYYLNLKDIYYNSKFNTIFDLKYTEYKKIPFDDYFRLHFILNILNIKLYDKESMYCSEFIGTVLKDFKLLEDDIDINKISPGSFEHMNKYNSLKKIIIEDN